MKHNEVTRVRAKRVNNSGLVRAGQITEKAKGLLEFLCDHRAQYVGNHTIEVPAMGAVIEDLINEEYARVKRTLRSHN